jgi:hypothetical protein
MRDDCRHPSILRFVGDNLPSMWACASCSLRFYPACPTCVSVGHRFEHDYNHAALAKAALELDKYLDYIADLTEEGESLVSAIRNILYGDS